MPKRILLIDSDESFTEGLAAAVTAAGFRASTASDSEQGMALAKQDNPDLIVVCVEAQPTNGYMLCTRIKKDERLKQIPVILTSANATPDSFEKHKKLKTRAEDYLIKPFAPQAMLQKAAVLLGMPAPGDGEGALSTDDESLGLGDLVEGEDEPIQLGESEAAEAHGAAEEAIDVEELEELVEIDEEVEPAAERSSGDEDLAMFDQAFDALKPTNGAAPAARPAARSTRSAREPTELTAPSDDEMLGLTDDAELAIESEPADPEPARAAERPRDRAKAGDELSLEEALTGDHGRIAELEEETRRLQAELDKAREEVAELTGEKDLVRDERDELQQKVEQAQAAAKQNEQRAIKAYQKMKGDEKLRDKTRKALQIALALLDDVSVDVDAESEKESA